MIRLPRARLRFSVRMLLALPILAALLLVIPSRCITGLGDGAPITKPLEFIVLDGGAELPIEGASIQIPQTAWSKAGFTATTDSDGRARIQFDTIFSEGGNSFFRIYRHVTYHAVVDVAAKDYRTKRFDLSELTAEPAYHYDTVPPPIILRMEKLRHESGR